MVLLASNMYVKTFRINRNKQVIKLLDKPSDKLTIHFFFFWGETIHFNCVYAISCYGSAACSEELDNGLCLLLSLLHCVDDWTWSRGWQASHGPNQKGPQSPIPPNTVVAQKQGPGMIRCFSPTSGRQPRLPNSQTLCFLVCSWYRVIQGR